MDRKVISYNLTRLGFTQSLSNTYEFQNNHYLIKVVVNGKKSSMTITITYQSVHIVAKVTRAIMGLRFTYKVRRGLNGEEVSFKVSVEGYRGFAMLLEALQKLLRGY